MSLSDNRWCGGSGRAEWPGMCGSLDPKLKGTLGYFTGHVFCPRCKRAVKAKRVVFTRETPGRPSIVFQCYIPAHREPKECA